MSRIRRALYLFSVLVGIITAIAILGNLFEPSRDRVKNLIRLPSAYRSIRSAGRFLTVYRESGKEPGKLSPVDETQKEIATGQLITESKGPESPVKSRISKQTQSGKLLPSNTHKETFGVEKIVEDKKLTQKRRDESKEVDKLSPMKSPVGRAQRIRNSTQSKIDKNKLFTKQKEVGQRQRRAVDKFCRHYKLDKEKYILPRNKRDMTLKKLLLDSKSKTMYCIVPKVGSTSLVVLFFIAMGLLPESMASVGRNNVPFLPLHQLVHNHSMGSVSEEDEKTAIRTYFKFMMYRDPLERLASGYRSKVQRFPLIGLEASNPHYNWLRAKIYQYTHPNEYTWWKEKGAQQPINIPFCDFIEFWLTSNDYKLHHDPHFVSFLKLCEPCRVRYNYYGHFDSFEEDANILAWRMGAKPQQVREGYYIMKSAFNISRDLYDELNPKQKTEVLKKLAQDIDFYYHIFPENTDSHKRLLRMNIELPVS